MRAEGAHHRKGYYHQIGVLTMGKAIATEIVSTRARQLPGVREGGEVRVRLT